MGNAHHLYQKRKHEGTEDSADVHKHKKSKVAHCYYFLADTITFIQKFVPLLLTWPINFGSTRAPKLMRWGMDLVNTS
jgi:hypothetical protein